VKPAAPLANDELIQSRSRPAASRSTPPRPSPQNPSPVARGIYTRCTSPGSCHPSACTRPGAARAPWPCARSSGSRPASQQACLLKRGFQTSARHLVHDDISPPASASTTRTVVAIAWILVVSRATSVILTLASVGLHNKPAFSAMRTRFAAMKPSQRTSQAGRRRHSYESNPRVAGASGFSTSSTKRSLAAAINA